MAEIFRLYWVLSFVPASLVLHDESSPFPTNKVDENYLGFLIIEEFKLVLIVVVGW